MAAFQNRNVYHSREVNSCSDIIIAGIKGKYLFKHVTVRISVSVRESFHCSEYDWVRTYWRHRSFSALKTARLRNRNIKVGGWVQKVMVISLADCFQVALAKLNVAYQLVAIQKWQNSQNKRFSCC